MCDPSKATYKGVLAVGYMIHDGNAYIMQPHLLGSFFGSSAGTRAACITSLCHQGHAKQNVKLAKILSAEVGLLFYCHWIVPSAAGIDRYL